jgi:D,D-heptose 1,7-bisphosphate phosphatase
MTSTKIDLVILAGGIGSRLKKFLGNLPKPMIRINNKSFLSYLINNASLYNFNKIYIMTGYRSSLIKSKFHKKEFNFVPVECIKEKKPLGTGGCLSLLKKKISKEFIVLNGDTFVDIDFQKLLRKKIHSNEIVMVIAKMNQNENSNQLTSLSIKDNKISFHQKGKYFNAGVYKLNKKNIQNFKDKFLSFENDFLKKKINEKKVIPLLNKNLFIDIGTPKTLKKSHVIFKNRFYKPAAFFDRDGTINFDYKYVHKIQNFHFRPGIIRLLKYLTIKKYYIFIVTNQAGIAKKKFLLSDFKKLHIQLKNIFLENNIKIHEVIFCPYHPKALIKKYKKNSGFRKPGNLMIEALKKKWDINLKKSFFIGDQKIDHLASQKSNLNFYYARNNYSSLIKKIKNY